MGGSTYNTSSRITRAAHAGYSTLGKEQIFKAREVSKDMSVATLTVRECRDNPNHPKVSPIILGLDVTGSMGYIPHSLVVDGLPKLMTKLIDEKLDTALCFVAIGDHKVDRGPLQVGQFESGDAELDHWLTSTWLEGGGGGNNGESYALAWLFAANHTSIDSMEKRGEKGLLITIGDENCHLTLDPKQVRVSEDILHILKEPISVTDLLKEVQKKYEVFHLNLNRSTDYSWDTLLGEHNIKINSDADIVPTIVALAKQTFKEVELTEEVAQAASTPAQGGNKVDPVVDLLF